MQDRKRRATEAPKKTRTKVLVPAFKSNVADLLRCFITLAHLGPGDIILGFLSFADLESLMFTEKALRDPSTLAILKQFALPPAIVGKTAQAATENQTKVQYPDSKAILTITKNGSLDIKDRIAVMQKWLNHPVHCDMFRNLHTRPYTIDNVNELKNLVNYKRLFKRHNKIYDDEIRFGIQSNPDAADIVYKNGILKATCSDLTFQSKSEDSRGLKVVLKYFKDVNRHDEEGFTALACAAANGRIENVKLLLSAGSDISITCNTGQIWALNNSPIMHTPQQFAEENGHSSVALFLSQKEREKEKIEMLLDGNDPSNEPPPNNQCCIM
ncbi:MAG: hypothetical protein ACYCQI_09140 [Gammaproteobacteria bacterium]